MSQDNEKTGADSLEASLEAGEEVVIGPQAAGAKLIGEFDASVWAREFLRIFGERRDEIDEGLMIGWFANAIMTGWDVGRQRLAEEGTLTIRNDTDVPVEYRVVPVDEPRFGGRVLRWLENDWLEISAVYDSGLRDIADAIDQDAEKHDLRLIEACQRDEKRMVQDLRRKVEELVEELRYTWGRGIAGEGKDVLDAEPFLERLAGIFGERGEEDGVAMIARERRRQVTEEGWSADHDDSHEEGQLSEAAACYALNASGGTLEPPADWPWDRKWWKPADPIKDLVRAGALIAAEIDRLRRRLPPEHERASERRERQSAKFERDGRVEGVDR